jgi:hypothetical protein
VHAKSATEKFLQYIFKPVEAKVSKGDGFWRQHQQLLTLSVPVLCLLAALIQVGPIDSQSTFLWELATAPWDTNHHDDHLMTPGITAIDVYFMPLDMHFEVRHEHVAAPMGFLFYVLGQFFPAPLRMAILAGLGIYSVYVHLGFMFVHMIFWTSIFYLMMTCSSFFSKRPFLMTIFALTISLIYYMPFKALEKGVVEYRGLFQVVWMVWAMQVSMTAHHVYDGLYLAEDAEAPGSKIPKKDVASRMAKAVFPEEFTLQVGSQRKKKMLMISGKRF